MLFSNWIVQKQWHYMNPLGPEECWGIVLVIFYWSTGIAVNKGAVNVEWFNADNGTTAALSHYAMSYHQFVNKLLAMSTYLKGVRLYRKV